MTMGQCTSHHEAPSTITCMTQPEEVDPTTVEIVGVLHQVLDNTAGGTDNAGEPGEED